MKSETLLGLLLGSLLASPVVFWFAYTKMGLNKAILIGLILIISILIGGFISAQLFYTR